MRFTFTIQFNLIEILIFFFFMILFSSSHSESVVSKVIFYQNFFFEHITELRDRKTQTHQSNTFKYPWQWSPIVTDDWVVVIVIKMIRLNILVDNMKYCCEFISIGLKSYIKITIYNMIWNLMLTVFRIGINMLCVTLFSLPNLSITMNQIVINFRPNSMLVIMLSKFIGKSHISCSYLMKFHRVIQYQFPLAIIIPFSWSWSI